MANLSHFQNSAADPVGHQHQHQHHKLVDDTPNQGHSSDQRQSPSTETTTRGANHTGGKGCGESTSEEGVNEDDDEDSADQDADQGDEEDDPDVLAPSCGLGKGKGKRPAIRIEPAGDDDSQEDEQDEEETSSHEAELMHSTLSVNPLLTPKKKRTFSNVSNTSLLFGEHDTEERSFPRIKVPRKLSNIGGRPLLAYTKDANSQNLSGYENAVESDDEDKVIDVDDEDYSGVNLISDDESDVENVEQQEEHFIVSDEQQRTNALLFDEFSDRRLSLDSHASDNIFAVTAPLDENFLAGINMPDVGFGQFFEPQDVRTSPDPNAKRKYSDSSTKRVRFDDEIKVSSSSSSSSSELDSTLFPDLFMEQDKLPPSLYQMIENDNDDTDNGDYASPGSDRSYWDLGQDESRSIRPNHTAEFDESSDAGSSGYETDMGDTTDEYESEFGSPAPPLTPLQKSVLRRPSSAPGSKAASPKPFQRSSRPAPTGRTVIPPLRGIFIHDESSKAIAVTNRATKTLTFYRPRVSASQWNALAAAYSSSASTADNSPRASLQQFNISDSEMSQEVFKNNNPFTADIMLTGIYGSAPANNFLSAGDSIGPPEAFYPFISIGDDGNAVDDDIDDDFDDDEDFEDDINIGDFMDFGSDMEATDGEQEEDVDVPTTPATSMVALNGSTPAHPTPIAETPTNRTRDTSDIMLEHFDRGVVTAFRNNQNRHRDIACLPHDPDLRASVSRPIRSGRSAEALISPLRKRGVMPKKQIGSSPFAGVTKATSRLQSSVMNSRRGPPRMGTFS